MRITLIWAKRLILAAMAVTVDLNPNSPRHNVKQRAYFDEVMRAVARVQTLNKIQAGQLPEDLGLRRQVETDNRIFLYGGAVSGGKTVITCTILILLCKAFPGSRWHVIRKDFTDLERTAKETLNRIIEGSGISWKRTRSDEYLEWPNGSRIYLMAENFAKDKDLNRFKGLETNGFLLEQMEELQRATFYKAIERAGRWAGVKGGMPPPLILGTFNPTWGWLKKEIHDKWKAGELRSPYHYQQALPSDNPWNTSEQWRAWQNLDPESYDRFIRGNWEIKVEGAFFHAFNDGHIYDELPEPRYGVTYLLSFDFNVDPMTATLHVTDEQTFFYTIREWRQPNSDIYRMCEAIREDIDPALMWMLTITGDASGKNRMAGVRSSLNMYEIIAAELGLDFESFAIPSHNPLISESRAFCNAIIHRIDFRIHGKNCPHTINDLRFTECHINSEGQIAIKKVGQNKYMGIDNKLMGHLADTERYALHIAFREWAGIPRS